VRCFPGAGGHFNGVFAPQALVFAMSFDLRCHVEHT
jgi:hypothetical protein